MHLRTFLYFINIDYMMNEYPREFWSKKNVRLHCLHRRNVIRMEHFAYLIYCQCDAALIKPY